MAAGKSMERKPLDSPEETRVLPEGKGKLQLVTIGDFKLGRAIFEPGWKWSRHVKPVVKTESCEAVHAGYVIEGRMRVRMNDGSEIEYSSGDACYIPSGHDAWIVGDKRCVMLDFSGAANYAKPK